MNKQNIWFLTLFSLILVLSVYYITMPSDIFLNNGRNKNISNELKKPETTVTISESTVLSAMRLSLLEERHELTSDLNAQLTSDNTTMEEKNTAYDKIRKMANITSMEEKLEKKLKDKLSLQTFIKIDESTIKVTAVSEKHDNILANNIMRSLQEEYKDKMYITVKFQNK